MSYNIVANEHGSLEALRTAKEGSADDESSGSDNVLSHKIHSPRKTSTALFNVEWYRLVLGAFGHLWVFVSHVDRTTRKMKLMSLRIGRVRPPLHALPFRRSIDGVLRALQCETFYCLRDLVSLTSPQSKYHRQDVFLLALSEYQASRRLENISGED